MENKSGLKDKLGDAVEAIGNKVSDMGAKDLGKKIHDAGDRIESSHKNPSHPVDPQVSTPSKSRDI